MSYFPWIFSSQCSHPWLWNHLWILWLISESQNYLIVERDFWCHLDLPPSVEISPAMSIWQTLILFPWNSLKFQDRTIFRVTKFCRPCSKISRCAALDIHLRQSVAVVPSVRAFQMFRWFSHSLSQFFFPCHLFLTTISIVDHVTRPSKVFWAITSLTGYGGNCTKGLPHEVVWVAAGFLGVGDWHLVPVKELLVLKSHRRAVKSRHFRCLS